MNSPRNATVEKLRRGLVPAAMILLLVLLLARATRPTAAVRQVGEEGMRQTSTGVNLADDADRSSTGNRPLFQSAVPTPTKTSTPVPTDTPTPISPTDTPTPIPPTDTPTPIPPTDTPTPIPPTDTPTPIPPTDTPTPIPPTDTPTPIPPTPTPTPLPPLMVGDLRVVDPPTGIVEIDVEISFAVVFTDPAYSDHSALWYWGDGTVEDQDPVDSSPAENSHIYREAGIYPVMVTISNSAGEDDSSTYESVVVYDPGDGFVTGGGWIDSPAGAYVDAPSLTGKATFAFVSKYAKGNQVPTGNTQFRFKIANLNFNSDQYDWLVVTGGDRAIFSGEGTINNLRAPQGQPYKFKIWATDGQPDTFRIRIWWELDDGTEDDIYDNGVGGSGNGQPIDGGSIVIHGGKGK